MVELQRINGAPDPDYIDDQHSFTVRFHPAHMQTTISSLSTESRMLAALSQHGPLSLSTMVNLLGWTGTKRQLRVVLERLRDESKVEIVGKGAGAKWRLSSDSSG